MTTVEDLEVEEDFVNEECPDRCSTEHDVPTDDEWTCPETEVTYRWCDGCYDQITVSRWHNWTEIDREWYCDPGEHEMYSCNDCGDYYNTDRISWDCYDAAYCEPCWVDRGGCSCSECNWDEEGYEEGDEPSYCSRCGMNSSFFHLVSEEWGCTHLVEQWKQANPSLTDDLIVRVFA